MGAPVTAYQPLKTMDEVFTVEQQQALTRELKSGLCTGKNKRACEEVVEKAVAEAAPTQGQDIFGLPTPVNGESFYQTAVQLSALDLHGETWNYSFNANSRSVSTANNLAGSTNGPDSGELCDESSATVNVNLGVTYGGRTVWKPLVAYTETIALTCQSYAAAVDEMKKQWEAQKAAEQQLQQQLQNGQ